MYLSWAAVAAADFFPKIVILGRLLDLRFERRERTNYLRYGGGSGAYEKSRYLKKV